MSTEHAASSLPLELLAIYLRSSTLTMAPGFNPHLPGQPLTLEASYRISPHWLERVKRSETGDESTVCTYPVDFKATYKLVAGEQRTQVAEIEAQFGVVYQLVPGDDGQMANVANVWANAQQPMVHAWGHWREYCHSSMMRMGLPVFMVPLLTLVQAAPNAELPAPVSAKAPKKTRQRKIPPA